MNCGSDFKLDDTGDIIFTDNGGIQTAEGTSLIAQDLKEEASISYGSLPWDETAGSHFFGMINKAGVDDEAVMIELERLALKDPRIEASSISAEMISEGSYRLNYTPLGYINSESLLFDLDTLLDGEIDE